MSLHDQSHIAQANATTAALAILNKARSLGIAVGTDGDDVVTVSTTRMPLKTIRWFAIWLDNFRDEVIDIIAAENAGRRA